MTKLNVEWSLSNWQPRAEPVQWILFWNDSITQEMTFFKSQIESTKMNVNVTSTECSLKQIVDSFSEDENYTFIAKFPKTVFIIPLTNAWPEREAGTVKPVKTRMRSNMKNDLLNGLLHILINGIKSHSNEAKVASVNQSCGKVWFISAIL